MKEIQVNIEHYKFSKYVHKRRWASYYYQVKEALESGCSSFLLIGVGDGLIPDIIRHYGGMVDTFDFDESLAPTYVGDLRGIENIVKKKYECVICCQVLEHLKFKYFESIISGLSNICTQRLILSLPCRMIEFSLYFALPHFGDKECHIIIPKFWERKLKWEGQHYWEVGIKGNTKKDIIKVINNYFTVVKDYNSPGHMYHWYVIADAKTT